MTSNSDEKKITPDTLMGLFYKIPFFKCFNTQEKLILSNMDTYVINYPKGSFIITEGQENDSLYILLKGEAYVTKDESPKVKLAVLKPGNVFGEIAFLMHSPPRLSNVITSTDVRVLKMDKTIVVKMGPEMEAKLRDQLLMEIVNKLERMNKALINFVRTR